MFEVEKVECHSYMKLLAQFKAFYAQETNSAYGNAIPSIALSSEKVTAEDVYGSAHTMLGQ